MDDVARGTSFEICSQFENEAINICVSVIRNASMLEAVYEQRPATLVLLCLRQHATYRPINECRYLR